VVVQSLQVEAGSGAQVEHDLVLPRGDLPHGLLDASLGIGRPVLDLVEVRLALDVG
jgi:hypothetical protein